MTSPLVRSPKFLLGLIATSLLLLVGAGVAFIALRGNTELATPTPTSVFGTPPALAVTPPESIEELATTYPQIGNLLLDESLSSVYKEFIVAYQTGGMDAARELAEKRGLLNDRDQVTITLVIDSAEHTEAVADELDRFGVIVLGTYDDLIDIAVPLLLVEQFSSSEQAGAMFAELSQLEHVVKLRLPIGTQIGRRLQDPEGPGVTGAEAWHEAGFTGQGVKVGVLDLGFDGYRRLLGTSLPETVVAKSFVAGEDPDDSGEVHGTACAEIVHAMAPDAELYLAYYSGTVASEGRAVEWLLSQGVDIITHSASSLAAPMDGTGPDVNIVNKARDQGVLWVNSSGNYADSHYRGMFTDRDGDGFHEFADGRETMGYDAPAGASVIILNWDDWEEADQDYDLYLYDEYGNAVASSQDSQTGRAGDEPVEGIIVNLDYDETLYIAIEADHADRPVRFDLFAPDGYVEFPEPAYSLGSPADAEAALTVGAVYWRTGDLEDFSSQGPTNDERLKPEIAAPDATTTETYAPEAFYGTSASTPHVAGAAALVLSAFPDFTPEQIAEYLTRHADDRGDRGPDNLYGYGALSLPKPGSAVPATAQPETVPTSTSEPATAAATGSFGNAGLPTPTALALVEPEPASPTATVPPAAVAGPAPTEAPVDDSGALVRVTGSSSTLLAALGGLMCLGTVGLIGGVTLLIMLTRRDHGNGFASAAPLPPPRRLWRAAARPKEGRPQLVLPADEPSATAGPAYLEGPGGQRFVLRQGDNGVGRSPESEVLLSEDSVSRRHALIRCHIAACTITDLASSNGTWLNGQRLKPDHPYPLNSGDNVGFGPDCQFVYRSSPGH